MEKAWKEELNKSISCIEIQSNVYKMLRTFLEHKRISAISANNDGEVKIFKEDKEICQLVPEELVFKDPAFGILLS